MSLGMRERNLWRCGSAAVSARDWVVSMEVAAGVLILLATSAGDNRTVSLRQIYD